jgi:uncharacterized protein (UPF0262 family)
VSQPEAGPNGAPHQRIAAITLDERSIVRWTPEIEHERDVAIFDLLEDNHFALVNGFPGPYRLHLSLRESTLVLDIQRDGGTEACEIVIPVRSLRRVIKDYFLICESYYGAIKGSPPSRIEAIDMARRGLHNEGAELLSEVMGGKIELAPATSRRLFTLICVLHLRG